MSKSKASKSDRNKPSNLELGAVSNDKQKRLDSSWYEEKYPHLKFMWIYNSGGEVDNQLRRGASIQKDELEDQVVGETHGYKGKNRNGYVSVIAGVDQGGNSVEQILMHMPKEEYQTKVIDRKHNKNQAIREAMGRSAKSGEASSADRDGAEVDTYAPNLPTGGQGFEEIAGKTGFNKLTG